MILFVLKKNIKLRLYIDYRKLNEIIINYYYYYYLLLNIYELRDRIIEINYFINLNFKEIYNLIRIKEKEE